MGAKKEERCCWLSLQIRTAWGVYSKLVVSDQQLGKWPLNRVPGPPANRQHEVPGETSARWLNGKEENNSILTSKLWC